MKTVKLEESKKQRRLHIGSYFVDLNNDEFIELVKIFSQFQQPNKEPDGFMGAETYFKDDCSREEWNEMKKSPDLKPFYFHPPTVEPNKEVSDEEMKKELLKMVCRFTGSDINSPETHANFFVNELVNYFCTLFSNTKTVKDGFENNPIKEKINQQLSKCIGFESNGSRFCKYCGRKKENHSSLQTPKTVEQDKWISVDERLPDDNQKILFCNNGAKWPREGVFLKEDEWKRKDTFCDGGFHLKASVYCWQPLPPAPGEKGGGEISEQERLMVKNCQKQECQYPFCNCKP